MLLATLEVDGPRCHDPSGAHPDDKDDEARHLASETELERVTDRQIPDGTYRRGRSLITHLKIKTDYNFRMHATQFRDSRPPV